MPRGLVILILLVATRSLAANWYIDNAAGGSNAGTSWANAWDSFASINWASISVGDTLYISGGSSSKVYAETLTIGASGSSGSPINIKPGAAEPSPNPSHSGRVVIQGTYAFPGGNPPNSNATRHGITGTATSYITINGNDGAGNRMIQMTNVNRGVYFANGPVSCIVRYISVTNSYIGVYMEADSGGLVEWNDLRMLDGGGIRVSGLYHAIHTSTVRNNYLEVRYYDGISADSGVDVYGNWIRKSDNEEWTTPPHYSHPDGIPIGGSDNYIYLNRFDGFEQNIYVDNIIFYTSGVNEVMSNVWIYGNLVTQIAPDPVTNQMFGIVIHSEMGPLSGIYVYNNTVAPITHGIRVGSGDGLWGITNLYVTNNILGNGYGSIDMRCVRAESWGSDNNCFSTVATWFTDLAHPAGYGIYDLATWRTTTGKDSSSISGSSSYVNEVGQDWRLSSASICKDAGVNLGVSVATALYGPSFPNPSTITRTGVWDIGAYEYVPPSSTSRWLPMFIK